ncbi:hypothetical protein AVEN_104813-1 [Araneus ventricosus]|uniref:Uncharacterized protein n=1 Tax=Araneus ventricosus TaxID=182803 RepID=A0A4Y2I9L2_ARAVE|nr:hypothetical protein AVEN_104813-1 [Araneus ventricosus]
MIKNLFIHTCGKHYKNTIAIFISNGNSSICIFQDYFHSAQIKEKLGKKSKEEPPQTNDVILNIIGHDGLWQRWIFLWMLLATMTVAGHYMAMSFYAPNLDYWCSRPDDSNRTVDEWKNVALPEDKRCSR